MFAWDDFYTAFWAFFVLLPLVTLIHQLGHYLMALLFGGNSELVVGRGKTLFEIGTSIKVRAFYFLDSACHYESLKIDNRLTHILVHAGGILLNLISVIIVNSLIMIGWLPELQFFYQFGYFSVYYIFFALFPVQYSETHASDGKQIINIFKKYEPSDIFD
ncbi:MULTISPECIES: hypothetical protein [unclassified Virgibacillus]|uniref:hypothetical protein n=1 Tax=unclassified Virgibacillus TaxID=2620237 RepID=UPI0024DE3444|nr:hypothetical protein [Virgibacillus sp. LDC-1]